MLALRGYGLMLVAALVGAAIVGGVGCGENEIPAFPSYMRDIKPLMEARCIRCHGAGGTLNADPDIPPVTNQLDPRAPYVGTPKNGYFTQLANIDQAKFGLMFYATTGRPLMDAALPFMPPPPAPGLTSREHEILTNWLSLPGP